MKKLVILGIAIIVIAAYAYRRYSLEGENAFTQSKEALRQVKSWKMSMEISRRSAHIAGRTEEANCPDEEHIVEEGFNGHVEYIRLVDDVYYRKGRDLWTHGKPGLDLFMALPTPRPCLSEPGTAPGAPREGIQEMDDFMDSIIKHGNITKLDVQTLEGASCQNWQVMAVNQQSKMVVVQICLGLDDHLPHKLAFGEDSLTIYMQWNVPVTVELPPTREMSPDSALSPTR